MFVLHVCCGSVYQSCLTAPFLRGRPSAPFVAPSNPFFHFAHSFDAFQNGPNKDYLKSNLLECILSEPHIDIFGVVVYNLVKVHLFVQIVVLCPGLNNSCSTTH